MHWPCHVIKWRISYFTRRSLLTRSSHSLRSRHDRSHRRVWLFSKSCFDICRNPWFVMIFMIIFASILRGSRTSLFRKHILSGLLSVHCQSSIVSNLSIILIWSVEKERLSEWVYCGRSVRGSSIRARRTYCLCLHHAPIFNFFPSPLPISTSICCLCFMGWTLIFIDFRRQSQIVKRTQRFISRMKGSWLLRRRHIGWGDFLR